MLIFKAMNAAESVPCTAYRDYEKTEELNGALQISFTVPKTADNTAAFSLLDYETEVVDTDGHVYVVKQITSNHTTKSAVAIHKFFTLSDVFRHDIIGGEAVTLKALFDLIFTGTNFTYTLDSALQNKQLAIYNFGGASATSLLETLCKHIGADRYITGANTVHITNNGGRQTDHVFQYADNIKTLEYEVDTTNIKTVIRGLSEKITGATVYKSPNASIFGEREQEPHENNELETVAAMVAELKAQLTDEPEVTITLDVLTLDANVGERVYLIHQPLGLNMNTRVIERTTARDSSASSITIGNTVRRSIGEVLADHQAEITTNERYTRSRFEQTRDRITAEVEEIGESIATLEIKADKISTSVTDLRTDAFSKITQTAKEIRQEVSDGDGMVRSLIIQTAGSIRSEITDVKEGASSALSQTATAIRGEVSNSITTVTNAHNTLAGKVTTNTTNIAAVKVTADSVSSKVSTQTTQISNLGTRISSAESSITQHSNEIEARVKTTDFTGNEIIGKINLTSTTATISARNINLVGAVTVLSNITGNLGTITAGTISSVNITSANIDISEDVKIGNKLYLYGGYGSGIYFDRFGGTGKVYTNGNNMVMSSDAFEMTSFYGIKVYGGMDVFNGLTVDGASVATTRTSGLSFGYSTANGRLYVTLNGTDVGFVALT